MLPGGILGTMHKLYVWLQTRRRASMADRRGLVTMELIILIIMAILIYLIYKRVVAAQH